MLKSLMAWHNQYYGQISWFLIGLFIAFGITDVGQHDYLSAVINFGLALTNYIFRNSK
jgi:hypothetical protein